MAFEHRIVLSRLETFFHYYEIRLSGFQTRDFDIVINEHLTLRHDQTDEGIMYKVRFHESRKWLWSGYAVMPSGQFCSVFNNSSMVSEHDFEVFRTDQRLRRHPRDVEYVTLHVFGYDFLRGSLNIIRKLQDTPPLLKMDDELANVTFEFPHCGAKHQVHSTVLKSLPTFEKWWSSSSIQECVEKRFVVKQHVTALVAQRWLVSFYTRSLELSWDTLQDMFLLCSTYDTFLCLDANKVIVALHTLLVDTETTKVKYKVLLCFMQFLNLLSQTCSLDAKGVLQPVYSHIAKGHWNPEDVYKALGECPQLLALMLRNAVV